MKNMILLGCLVLSIPCFSQELTHFNDVKSAILNGQPIHMIFDFVKCSTTGTMNETIAVGAFTPNEIAVINDKIATSFSHFTLNNPAFLNKPIYEFSRYTLTSDNNLNLTIQVLNAADFKPLGEKMSMDCSLGNGAKIFS